MSDPVDDLVDWQLADPPAPAHVRTTCFVCGSSWDQEVAQCPNGCVWELEAT